MIKDESLEFEVTMFISLSVLLRETFKPAFETAPSSIGSLEKPQEL